MSKRQAYLQISPDLIVSLVTSVKEPRHRYSLEVIENALPTDTEFVRAEIRNEYGAETIIAVVESEAFKGGEMLPLPVLKQTPIIPGGSL